jgi:hypothetical protein
MNGQRRTKTVILIKSALDENHYPSCMYNGDKVASRVTIVKNRGMPAFSKTNWESEAGLHLTSSAASNFMLRKQYTSIWILNPFVPTHEGVADVLNPQLRNIGI